METCLMEFLISANIGIWRIENNRILPSTRTSFHERYKSDGRLKNRKYGKHIDDARQFALFESAP